ncbi:MAG: aminotransferase class IV [Vicinamibacteria bacterium]|nr:aminotransferase class IV [Vicinamibacteria bacterium]
MGFAVSIDGRVGSPEEVTLKITDNGFVFGDSAYETLRTYDGRPFELDRHLARLRRSIALLGFDLKTSDDQIKVQIDACLAFARNDESYLRVIVSRGVGDMTYRFERIAEPTVAMFVKPLEPSNAGLYEKGASAVIASLRRNPIEALNPAIKASNLLNNALATREAYAKGAFEAILLNTRGEVAEGAGSNVFIVKDSLLLTPPLSCGLLPGITRELTLEIAAATSIAHEERVLFPADLQTADELFITSTLKELAPVVTLDGAPIGSGQPGPLTARLLASYRERIKQAQHPE